ncbi:MAG: M12 family metallo-peptidase, partial [Phycisphaerales bacterium]
MLKQWSRGVGRCALAAIAMGWCAGTAQAQVGLDRAIFEELNLNLYSVQRISIEMDVDSYVRANMVLDGKPTQMSLFRHSMRGPDMQVLAVDEDGVEHLVEPGPMRTYRGMLSGFRGAKVAASVTDAGQIEAWIRLPHEVWVVQPLSDAVPGADPDLHVVYRTTEVLPTDHTCGVVDEPGGHGHPHVPGQPSLGGGLQVAEISFDADTEYYTLNGSSVPATVADIESVMNAVDMIYNTELGLGFEFGTFIVRTGPDPYTTTDYSLLLSQFQNEWTTNQAGIVRDVAHLFTGRDLDGTVIGVAFFDGVCDFDLGYGLSQSRYTNTFANRVALTSHELGHNYDATHCNGDGDCAIMCSGIGGCTGILDMFGNSATAEINAYVNSIGCLEEGGI